MKRTRLRWTYVFFWLVLVCSLASGATAQEAAYVGVLEIEGPVTPIMISYIERGIGMAEDDGAQALVVLLDTPGGQVDLMNEVVQAILRARVPVVIYVYPSGAYAASAGTLITLAGHVAAMAPGTTIGAASPVGGQGEDLGETMEAKLKEDLKAQARALAERRGEEAVAWAESAVEEARAATAGEALDLGVIDFVASDLPDLLQQMDGFQVTVGGQEVTLETAGARIEELPMTFVEELLHTITNPTIAFILLTIGINAILFELASPGGYAAGVVGVICLLLAFYALGVLPPSAEPRATGHITQIVELIERLIHTGHAYPSLREGDADVYFDVLSFADYGRLSGHRIDDVHQGEGVGAGKRDRRDFTLWKAAKPGEPSWPTPWGRGRPGWHSECVAMAHEYLGAEFDIHCGGMDLVFPHHENEIAQARAAGDGFARFWLHNGWVTMGGEKMSKSLGNVLAVPAVLARVRPAELRYYLGSAHYRSMLEFSETALHDAARAYTGIEEFLHRVAARAGAVAPTVWTGGFAAAMDDDLGVPAALAEVHAARAEGNRALEAGDHDTAVARAGQIRAMMGVLGCDPLDERWQGHDGAPAALAALDVLARAEIARREDARERRDWAAADEIRDRLKTAGIEVTDTADGPQWALLDRKGR